MAHTALLVRTASTIVRTQRFLETKGVEVIPAPVMRIEGVFPEPTQLKSRLNRCEILCCLSQNAAQQLKYYQGQLPEHNHIWSIGAGTRQVMQSFFEEIHSPLVETSEGLFEELVNQIYPGVRVGLLKGAGGREFLTRTLSNAGAIIDPINLYARVVDEKALQNVSELLAFQKPSVIMVGSGELLQTILPVLVKDYLRFPVVVPGARVSALAKKLGFKHIVEAKGASAEELFQALSLI